MDSGAAGAASAAGVVQAIRACGTIVQLEPAEFRKLLNRDNDERPLVVKAEGGFFSRSYQYLTSYKGLTFYCRSGLPLTLPRQCEVVAARKIWIPG